MQDIKDQLKKVIQDLYGIDFDPDVTVSPDNIDADYSSNAPLKLARDLHKSPMEIANEILGNLVRAGDAAGGTPSRASARMGEAVAAGPVERYTVILSEGRNRQIRRTFAALGYKVVKLHRTEFGPFKLTTLKLGNYEVLDL